MFTTIQRGSSLIKANISIHESQNSFVLRTQRVQHDYFCLRPKSSPLRPSFHPLGGFGRILGQDLCYPVGVRERC